jgi:hypothetical protein
MAGGRHAAGEATARHDRVQESAAQRNPDAQARVGQVVRRQCREPPTEFWMIHTALAWPTYGSRS